MRRARSPRERSETRESTAPDFALLIRPTRLSCTVPCITGRKQGRSAARSRALHRVQDTRASDAFGALFTFQTAHLVPAARFSRPGFATLLRSPRIEGWAERRETFGCSAEHPLGLHMTRQARRLRGALRPIARQDARERAYDAGRSPLGAPPWRFWAPGAALSSPAFAPVPLALRSGIIHKRPSSEKRAGT